MQLALLPSSGVLAARQQGTRRRLLTLSLACALLSLAAILSVTFGTRDVAWPDIARALSGQSDTIGAAAVSARLPRTALAMLAGAGLALAGTALQGVTRNPLADPGILGINAGAALAVVVMLAWGSLETGAAYALTASLGAALAAGLVQAIASMGRGRATPLKLALAGAATSAALASFTTAIILPRNDIAGLAQSWQIGGVGGATWAQITPVLPFFALGIALVMLNARRLNLLALGEETASGLGENVQIARGLAVLGAILLCGAATATCGPIGFVGLVVPHLMRALIGVDYRWLIPASALVGAALLTGADVAGRLIARPAELDVGILTAFLGAPVFIWIVRRRKLGAL